MEERNLPQIVIGKFKEHAARIFSSAGDWERHLQALGLSAMNLMTPLIFRWPRKYRQRPGVRRASWRTARSTAAIAPPALWGSTRRACSFDGTASGYGAWWCLT